jgi:DNA-binding NtrC family response regulator
LKPGLDTGEVPAKGGAKGLSWDRVEKSFIYEALRRNQWNRTVTAEQLGIHPTTLWRKMKRLKMEVSGPES